MQAGVIANQWEIHFIKSDTWLRASTREASRFFKERGENFEEIKEGKNPDVEVQWSHRDYCSSGWRDDGKDWEPDALIVGPVRPRFDHVKVTYPDGSTYEFDHPKG